MYDFVTMITTSFPSLMFQSANIAISFELKHKYRPISHEITLDLVFFSQILSFVCV